MALVEVQFMSTSLGGEVATASITYEDTNGRIQDLIIRNPLSDPLEVWGVITLPGGAELYRSTVVGAGESVFGVPGNRKMVDVIDEDGTPIKTFPFVVSFGARRVHL